MIQVVWEFIVKETALDAFQQAYAPGGSWTRLFEAYPGYRGTTLLRDTENPRRFITIDAWATARDRERMQTEGKAAYVNLDELLADLTEDEDELGVFTTDSEVPVQPRVKQTRGKTKAAGRTGRRTRG
jgi:hypothetical protein